MGPVHWKIIVYKSQYIGSKIIIMKQINDFLIFINLRLSTEMLHCKSRCVCVWKFIYSCDYTVHKINITNEN